MFKSKMLSFAIICFGVLPPLIILTLYDYSMSGEFFSLLSKGINVSLSKESGSWADFGSLLAGVFTLLGAIASLATLIFLLQQQKKSEQDRLEQLKIQREIQNKNDLHLHSERELMNFEMYKIHNDMFNSLLDNLERKMHSKMRFVNRSFLYKGIFPDNGFYKFNGKANLDKDNILRSLIMSFKCILEKLSQVKDKFSANSFLTNYNLFNELLGLRNEGEIKEFDVTYHREAIGINIFYINEALRTLSEVIDALLIFSENKAMAPFVIPDDWYSSFVHFYSLGESKKEGENSPESSLLINIYQENKKCVNVISHLIIKCEELQAYNNYVPSCYRELQVDLSRSVIFKYAHLDFQSICIDFSININNDIYNIELEPSLELERSLLTELSDFISQENLLDIKYPLIHC
ncbi:hypothetical protein [Rahnella sp. PAMC 25559]|uniref:hypothetical protein n=1 Tax=Rahnella sp. PAMC 25559 TaxID=3423225 RepID=UPI003D672138